MKRNNSWLGLAIVAGLIALLGATCMSQYNRLVSQREAVDGAWAQVENMIQRRADLIPNLVQTVKGYAAHEEQIFSEVADARSRMLLARGPAEAESASRGLDQALGRLLAIAERYPDLKANQNFLALQDELAGSENRIAVERMRYNDRVREYNARIRSFPARLFASALGFDKRAYFEAENTAKTVPKVEFGS